MMTESPKQAMTFEDFKKEVLNDYKIATTSRECSLLGRREVICKGTPEEIIKNKKSFTAQFLKKELL